jgi:hypothetical protein
VEFQLTDVKDCSENLANVGNLITGELELSQRGLEVLETFRVVYANLQLRGMSKVTPPFLATSKRRSVSRARCHVGAHIESQVLFLGWRCAGQQIVENVVVPLSRGNSGNSAAFKSVIQDLATNQSRVKSSRGLILKLEEKTRL